MTLYRELVADAQALGPARITRVPERTWLRLLYDSLERLVGDIAKLQPNTSLLPRFHYTKLVDERSLVEGIDISPTSDSVVSAVVAMLVKMPNGQIRRVTKVDEEDQQYIMTKLPAGFVVGNLLFPVVGRPLQRTVTRLLDAGWRGVTEMDLQVILAPADPGANRDAEVGLHQAFLMPAVLRAISIVGRDAALTDRYRRARLDLVARATARQEKHDTVVESW